MRFVLLGLMWITGGGLLAYAAVLYAEVRRDR